MEVRMRSSHKSDSAPKSVRGVVGRQGGALASPPTDVGPWGGSIGFDKNWGSWYFSLESSGISSGQLDFFTVAEHELGHLLGFNNSNPGSWMTNVSNGKFV